jgi:mannitol-1-/sugar-/sorbitol-6-phosphatase
MTAPRECFLLAAARLGVDARSCLVLEDAPAGIAAGRAAGARVIALRTTRPDEALRDAHAIVDTVASILAY